MRKASRFRADKAAAARLAAVIVLIARIHVPEVLTDGVDDIAQLVLETAASNNVAGILHRELDFQVFVPIRVDFQLSLPDPLGIVFVDVFDFKFMLDVEFFQSGPD